MFKALSETVLVAGQIRPDDIAEAAALGVTTVINNRPDGEEPGQPAGADIARAAAHAGLSYHHIPVAGGIEADQVAAMTGVLERAEGTVLAFCRSGTRSTYLWALAEAGRGVDGARLIEQAAAAGYDLAPLRPYLG